MAAARMSTGDATIHRCVINSEPLMCRKFTLSFTTNFVGLLDIRAFREVFPIGVRSSEIVGVRPSPDRIARSVSEPYSSVDDIHD